jgi:hypothetical protein
MSQNVVASAYQFGPAMQALTERQRAFVIAMFEQGAKGTYTGAARTAGYGGTPNSLRVQAHALAHSDKVQAAMREEAERRIGGLLPIAHAGLVDIITNPGHEDHFKAIKHAQALSGLAPKQTVVVEHKTDRATLLAELKGAIDLLKSVAPTMIDVTPTVIEHQPEEDWTAL